MYFLIRRDGGAGWQRQIDPEFLSHLKVGDGAGFTAVYTAVGVGLLISCLALAGPAWRSVGDNQGYNRQGTIVLLDLSPSMLAEDIKPNRLVRARLKLIDFLRSRVDGETALIVYAGDAHRVAPLTRDPSVIEALVLTLEPGIMPVAGSRPEDAVALALSLFEGADLNGGDIILITDGVADDAIGVIRQRLHNYRLSVFAIGTATGAPIPDSDGRYLLDKQGNLILARVNTEALRTLAVESGGRFTEVTNDSTDIETLMSLPPQALQITKTDDGQNFDEQHDAGYWLVLLLLPIAMLAFRRQVFWVVLPMLVVAPEDGYAFSWQDLWLSKDQQAVNALAAGDASRAAELFTDEIWQAVAQYKAGEYARAAELFEAATGADAFYNLANALALAGDSSAAIEAYRLALAVDLKHIDAAHNLALLRSLTEPQEAELQQQQNQQPTGTSSDQIETAGTDAITQNQATEGQQQQIGGAIGASQTQAGSLDQSNMADGGQSSEIVTGIDQSTTDGPDNSDHQSLQPDLLPAETLPGKDNEQAVDVSFPVVEKNENQVLNPYSEQWLRNLPQDPGGYLRRKFQHQAQLRRESGNPPDNDVPERY